MRSLYSLGVVVAFASSSALAAPCGMHRGAGSALPYSAGEELSYSMRVGGVAAGRAHLKIGGLERTPYGVGYPIRADLETNACAPLRSRGKGRRKIPAHKSHASIGRTSTSPENLGSRRAQRWGHSHAC